MLQNKGISKERRKNGMLDTETSNQLKDGWDGVMHGSLRGEQWYKCSSEGLNDCNICSLDEEMQHKIIKKIV